MLAMTVIMGICMIIAGGGFSAYVTAKFTTRIRADLFRKSQIFSDLDYQKFSKETLLARATSDTTQMQSGIISISGLIVYIQYSIQLANGFATIMGIVNALPRCEVSEKRIVEVLDYSPKTAKLTRL